MPGAKILNQRMTPTRVADQHANQNRPQHVFDIRQGDFVIGAVLLDRRFDPFAGVADRKQQREARNGRDESDQKVFGRRG